MILKITKTLPFCNFLDQLQILKNFFQKWQNGEKEIRDGSLRKEATAIMLTTGMKRWEKNNFF